MRYVRQIVQCAGLILLAATGAFSQQLQSGALLTIQGTSPVANRAVYDSQIHSGQVQQSPCDGLVLVTDAYVLQGGSPTGCDEGDNYEVIDSASMYHQFAGQATVSGTGYNLAITTFYLCGYSQESNNPCTYPTDLSTAPNFTPAMNGAPGGPFCNTNNTICTSPDTGFMAVTNNFGSSFTGTITLAGVAQSPGNPVSPYCTASGVDSITGVLASGSTWVFAIQPDSSNCGGYTQTQTQMLPKGGTVTFPFGPDEYEMGNKAKFLPGSDYILTGTNNAGGETIQFAMTPTLVAGNPNGSNAATFNPGTGTYKGFTIDPYGDLSEVASGMEGVLPTFVSGMSPNLVGAEVYLACSVDGVVNGGDCPTFFDTLTLDYTQPAGVTGAGNALLADNTVPSCPSNGTWNANTILSVAVTETKKKGSNPSSSCFAAANGTVNNEPAPLIQEGGSFVSYMGLELPFILLPPYFNFWVAGSKISAPFTFYYIAPNLTGASLSAEALPIACPKGLPANAHSTPVLLSGTLSNLTNLNPKLFPEVNGLTLYLYDAVELPKGCFDIVFSIANGPSIPFVQQFAFE